MSEEQFCGSSEETQGARGSFQSSSAFLISLLGMFLKILEMKFKAFILTSVSFCCLMVLIYIKVITNTDKTST